MNEQVRKSIILFALVILTIFVTINILASCGTDGDDYRRITSPTRQVRYEITGMNVSGVSLTWENNTGGTEQGDYSLPFRKFYGMNRGDFVYISAQIIQGSGWIECRIYFDGEEVYYARASGFASIASCSGSVR